MNPGTFLAMVGMVVAFYGVIQYTLAQFIASGPKPVTGALIAAAGCLLTVLGGVVAHDTMSQVSGAGAFVCWVWIWWHSGGGDGTKRRLRKLSDQLARLSPLPSPA